MTHLLFVISYLTNSSLLLYCNYSFQKSSLYSSTPRDSSSSHLINESLSTTPTSSLIGGKSNPSPVIGGIATPHSSVVGRLDTTPVSHKTSRSDHSISSLSGVATKSDQATSLSISAGGTRSDHSVKSIVSTVSGGYQTSTIITSTTCALVSIILCDIMLASKNEFQFAVIFF